MPNEDGKNFPTAQELAAKAVDMFGEGERVESWLTGAQEFLILTRAYAALRAERPQPERVRCWYVEDYGIVMNLASSDFIGRNITPGHFVPEVEE